MKRRTALMWLQLGVIACFAANGTAVAAQATEDKASGAASPAGGGRALDVPEGVYMIIARHSGLALNIPGALKHPGRMVAQTPAGEGKHRHLHWRFIKSDGFYRIQSVHSGLFLEVAEGWRFDGAFVVQWPERQVDHQLFSLRDAGGGNIRIVAKHSSKCLEVVGGWKTPSAAVVQWSEHNGDHQIFTLQPVPSKE